MEAEKTIKYLLIGNLITGKIIYEMINTNSAKIIYDINQLFNSFHKNKNNTRPEKIKVESYNIMINTRGVLMISKTLDSFSFGKNMELFKTIEEKVPYLSELSINFSLSYHRQNTDNKITGIIKEFFKGLQNTNLMNTVSYTNIPSKNNKTVTNNYNNEEEMTIKKKNSLISSNNNRSFDNDKNSINQLIQENNNDDTYNDENGFKKREYNNKVSVKILNDNNGIDKTNINKSLIQSNVIVKKNNDLQNSVNQQNMTKELDGIIRNISCCRKVIFIFLLLVIIAQIIIIPCIIKYSYSY